MLEKVFTSTRAGVAAVLGAGLLIASHSNAAPPSNGKIAFYAADPSGNDDIYAVMPDGSGLFQLTNSPDSEIAPAWSPDGTKIAYYRLDPGDEQYSLWIMNSNGTGQHEILRGQVGRYRPRFPIAPPALLVSEYSYPNAPAWSPDGKWILYSHARPAIIIPPGENDEGGTDESYAGELHLIRPDGSDDHDIACSSWECQRNEQFGRFSPNGKLISSVGDDYCPDCAGGQWVNIMNVDGSSPRVIGALNDPAWTPDGVRLLALDVRRNRLSTYSSSGTGEQIIYTDAAAKGRLRAPNYSPDGTRIVYEDDGNIYIIDPSGSGRTLVRSGKLPVWQPIPTKYVSLFEPVDRAVVGRKTLLVSVNVPADETSRVGIRACAAASCTYEAAPRHWGTIYDQSYARAYSVESEPDGPLTVVVRAFFKDGSHLDSSASVTLDRRTPSITLTAGAPSTGGIPLTATASDSLGVAKVGFRYCVASPCTYETGVAITTRTSAPFSATFRPGAAPYSYAFVARAFNTAGATADSAPVTVTSP